MGFEAVDKIDRPAVTIFGSARVREGEPSYEQARDVARRFAERKAQMNAMDFDDLLLNWKRLLIEVPGARESISSTYSKKTASRCCRL